MKKSHSILLLLLLFFTSNFAQKTEKELQKKTWYSNSGIGSLNLQITADNSTNPPVEIKFSPTGKLILKQSKKRGADSSCSYIIKKNHLTVNLNKKDSVQTFEYVLKKVPDKKAYQLSMKFSSSYIKKRGDDSIVMDQLVLMQGKKRKIIEYEQSLTVFSQKKALHNDSIDLAVWGQFAGYITDTLLIDSDQYVEHNFYKKYTDSLHYIAPLLLDTVIRIKIPIKEITGIHTQREPFTSYTTGATILGMCTGLACIGASLIISDNNTSGIFAEAGVISLLTIPVSFGMGMIFSTQKFSLQPGKKKNKIWKVERHMPNVIVTQRNQKQYSIKR